MFEEIVGSSDAIRQVLEQLAKVAPGDSTLHAEQCIRGNIGVPLRARHCCLSRQLLEQRLGVFQIGGGAALGEPAINFRERRTRFVAAILLRE